MDHKFRIIALAAASCLLFFACTPMEKEARTILAAADSLMDSDPHAALYSIMSIDSSVVPYLCKKDRALYLLLRTQARYKCYLPVSGDTAISEAVEYFHRRGPVSRYATALNMRGAVSFERGDFVSALEDYKDAEKIINEHNGGPIAAGLLHTRIAELYQLTFVNDSLTVGRYRKALECFQKSNRHDMVMQARLSLARALLTISPEESFSNTMAGAGLAMELSDSSMLLVAKELETAYHLIMMQYPDVIRTGKTALKDLYYPEARFEKSVANILLAMSTAYARSGYPDSARLAASYIPQEVIDEASLNFLYYDIALSENDFESALIYQAIGSRIADSTLSAGYQMHLRGVEKRYEISRINEKYTSLKNRYFATYMALSGALCIIAVIGTLVYVRNLRLRRKIEQCTDIIRNLNEDKSITLSNDTVMHDNNERISISEEMLKVTDELMEAYYKYGSTKAISSHVKAILELHFPKEGTMTRVFRIVDSTYPGFLTGLRTEHPSLSEKDLYLIALMACGFSTGTICALRRISENSLYVEKTRIAKKIGIGTKLADFITKALQESKQP